MKMVFAICLFTFCWTLEGSGQTTTNAITNGYRQSVSIGAVVPIGDFSSTHSIGASIDYSYCTHRLGLLSKKPSKLFGLFLNGGLEYYFGKHDNIAPSGYKYPGYTNVHGYAGIIYNPSKQININLTAGPALGIYNNNAEFWWGINLGGSYYFSKKIALSPVLIFMKQSIADPLVSAGLKLTRTF